LRDKQINSDFNCASANLEETLKDIIANSDWFNTLASIKALDMPDWWVAGGAIRNTVWKKIYGDKCSLGIKDLDVVFYDKNSGREQEIEWKNHLQQLHPNWIFDVKNQSSFGVWRPWRFTFTDSTDGIAHFLHTATGIGIKLDSNDKLQICQPHGLSDLFAGIIKCTPYRQDSAAAQKKQEEYLQKCPGLQAVD
jgi:hypothetical protein